jgi:hypothetical protein
MFEMFSGPGVCCAMRRGITLSLEEVEGQQCESRLLSLYLVDIERVVKI